MTSLRLKPVLFDGVVEGGAPAVALFDPHAPRELRAGVQPPEAFRLLHAHDRGAVALIRWHAPRLWRVAVTSEPPPRHTRAAWRRLEDQWIEVGPSGMAVVECVDRFADPDRDSVDGEAEPAAEVDLPPGRYRVARYDRRALVAPLDEGYETLHAGEVDVADEGPGARHESPEVAMVFALTPLGESDAVPSPALGAIRGWHLAITNGELDPHALAGQLVGSRASTVAFAALAELGSPDAVATLRRACFSDDGQVATAARAVARAYSMLFSPLPRRSTRV